MTRWTDRGPSGPETSTRIRAPIAARLVRVPTSLTVSQWWPWPGFWNRTLWALSPGVAPPASTKRSRSPSPSQSANETPCPFWRWPVPEDVGHVLEARAVDVLEHHVGHRGTSRQAGRSPGRCRGSRRCRCRRSSSPSAASDPVEPDLAGHVAEAVGADVAVEPRAARRVGRAGPGGWRRPRRASRRVVGDEEVEPAVVVVVPEPAGEAVRSARSTPSSRATSVNVPSPLLW